MDQFSRYNTGGTHEENPHNGIQIGYGDNDKPNLVEEGETKYNDYVYSNRLSLDSDSIVDSFLLPKNSKGKTFSEASENIMKDSEERPNDIIAIRGAKAMLDRLAKAQEEKKKVQEMYKNKIKEEQLKSEKEDMVKTLTALSLTNPELFNSIIANIQGNTINSNPTMEEDNIFSKGGSTTKLSTIPLDIPSLIPTLNVKQSIDNLGDKLAKQLSSAKEQQYIDEYNNYLDRDSKLANLRYISPVASGLQVLSDLTGLTNRNDFTHIDNLDRQANGYLSKGLITPPSNIGRKMNYTPLDTSYVLNQINSNAASNRRALLNSGMTNAGVAANLLANTFNTQNALGQAYRQAVESNLAQRNQALQYNNDLDFKNAQLQQQANVYNRDIYAKMADLQKVLTEAKLKEIHTNDSTKSINRETLIKNLYGIGAEAYNRVRANQRAGGKYYDNGNRIVFNPGN